MKYVLILIGKPGELKPELVRRAGGLSGAGEAVWLAPEEACELPFPSPPGGREVERLLDGWPVDWAVLPAAGRRRKLLIADMDSTIIEEESLDELAARAGRREEIAAITARAMRGELDFAQALQARVARLAGLAASLLEEVAASLTLRPGARALTAAMRRQGARTLLVSGGFACFVEPVAARAGFDGFRANRLEIAGGRITGKVLPPVLGAGEKLRVVEEASASEVLAVGDGANDGPMLKAAGLGVALHGKPGLQNYADVQLRHSGLAALLYLQGLKPEPEGPGA